MAIPSSAVQTRVSRVASLTAHTHKRLHKPTQTRDVPRDSFHHLAQGSEASDDPRRAGHRRLTPRCGQGERHLRRPRQRVEDPSRRPPLHASHPPPRHRGGLPRPLGSHGELHGPQQEGHARRRPHAGDHLQGAPARVQALSPILAEDPRRRRRLRRSLPHGLAPHGRPGRRVPRHPVRRRARRRPHESRARLVRHDGG